MSDTLISSLDTVGFSVPRVVLVLWHDQRYVWFVPKVAPSKHWVAKILVEVLVAHDLADIGKKNELELARVHWHAKKMATIQTKTNLWVMTKILVRCTLATIQTHPNTRLVIGTIGAHKALEMDKVVSNIRWKIGFLSGQLIAVRSGQVSRRFAAV